MPLALLACAAIARGDVVRLLAPAGGATLRGGSFAELRWTSGRLPPETEEWEAFLSVDGGKYYAYRVTPHLDIRLQRFTFVVPNVDTREARILIRTGNEVHETHIESRTLFSIVRDSNVEEILPRLFDSGRGESARDGDPGVLSWTDGARNGASLTRHSAAAVPAPSLGAVASVASERSCVLSPTGKAPLSLSITPAQTVAAERFTPLAAALPKTVDLLLVCGRRNV